MSDNYHCFQRKWLSFTEESVKSKARVGAITVCANLYD